MAEISSKEMLNCELTETAQGVDDLESIREEITGGLLYCHHRANTNTEKALEVTAFAYALIELLIDKGLLTEEELNERKRTVASRLVEKLKDNGMGVMLQNPEIDKYTFEKVAQVDCESRIHLCRAACCRFGFALSRQDLEEGIVRWNLSCPYMIRRDREGYCTHLELEAHSCAIYQHRPVPCRGYDCGKDERIWLDFENGTVSPKLEEMFQSSTLNT